MNVRQFKNRSVLSCKITWFARKRGDEVLLWRLLEKQKMD